MGLTFKTKINHLESRSFVIVLAFLCIALTTTTIASTDTTAIIKGRVIDKFSEKPLPFANIIVVGTNKGVAADIKGFYILKEVPIGACSLKCTMIGYSVTVKEVNVEMGCTTIVKFQLDVPRYIDGPGYPDIDTIDFGHDSLIDTMVCPLEVTIWAEKDTFLFDEQINIGCEIRNIIPYPILVIKPISGSMDKWRLPWYYLIIEDSTGEVFLLRKTDDFVGTVLYRLPGKAIILLKPNEVFVPFGKAVSLEDWHLEKITQPGKYYIRMHFKHNCDVLSDSLKKELGRYIAHCDIWTDPIEITVLGD